MIHESVPAQVAVAEPTDSTEYRTQHRRHWDADGRHRLERWRDDHLVAHAVRDDRQVRLKITIELSALFPSTTPTTVWDEVEGPPATEPLLMKLFSHSEQIWLKRLSTRHLSTQLQTTLHAVNHTNTANGQRRPRYWPHNLPDRSNRSRRVASHDQRTPHHQGHSHDPCSREDK